MVSRPVWAGPPRHFRRDPVDREPDMDRPVLAPLGEFRACRRADRRSRPGSAEQRYDRRPLLAKGSKSPGRAARRRSRISVLASASPRRLGPRRGNCRMRRRSRSKAAASSATERASSASVSEPKGKKNQSGLHTPMIGSTIRSAAASGSPAWCRPGLPGVPAPHMGSRCR